MPDRSNLRNAIIISADPQGKFLEGALTTGYTPKPGTCMQQDSSGNWLPGTPGADGSAQEVVILLPDYMSGQAPTTAYIDSAHCFLYVPANGDELNLLVANIAGTGDTHLQQERLMIQASSGKLIINSSGAMVPFTLLEAISSALTVDTLSLVRYNSN